MKHKKSKIRKRKFTKATNNTRLLQELSSRGIRIKQSVIRLVTGVAASCFCLVAMGQNPVIEFKADFDGSKTRLSWTATQGWNGNYFSIERSWNGKDFETIGLVRPHSSGETFLNYHFVDKDYYSSIIYYRLRVVDNELQSNLAGSIVSIQLAEDSREFVINPVLGLPGGVYIDAARLQGAEIIADAVDAEKQIIANAILGKRRGKISFEMRALHSLKPGTYTVSAFYDHKVIKARLLVKEQAEPGARHVADPANMNFTRK